jgi:hypothetical protein
MASAPTNTQLDTYSDFDLNFQIAIFDLGWEIADFGDPVSAVAVATSQSMYDQDWWPSQERWRMRRKLDGSDPPWIKVYCGTATEATDNCNNKLSALSLPARGIGETNRQCAIRICRALRDAA